MNVIGIDVSTLHLDVVVLDREGMLLAREGVDNEGGALIGLVRRGMRKRRIATAPFVC